MRAGRAFPEPEWARIDRERRERDGWVRLFDGVSLNGWKSSAPADSFDVVNGAIRAQASSDQSHLFYTGPVAGADFRDFELLIDCLATPGSNGGIYFHSKHQDTGWPDHGYETQVNVTQRDPVKTGSLYNVVKLYETPAKDDEWWTQTITVKGKNIVVKINDKVTADYTEDPEALAKDRSIESGRRIGEGTFALQAHDPGSTVLYRNIRVKRLD